MVRAVGGATLQLHYHHKTVFFDSQSPIRDLVYSKVNIFFMTIFLKNKIGNRWVLLEKGEKIKYAMQKKILMYGFYIKYSKFWSVLQEHFIESKPLTSEEHCWAFRPWICIDRYTMYKSQNNSYYILVFDVKYLKEYENSEDSLNS